MSFSSYKAPLLFLIAWPVCAHSASDDLFDLSLKDLLDVRVVTAASGFEQNVKDAPASVTVIEATEWQARGAQNLTQALQGVTSLNLSFVQVGYARSKYDIRGLGGQSGQQLQILKINSVIE